MDKQFSLLGFLAVIATVYIAIGHKKSSESEYYFKDYQTRIFIFEREKGSTGTWTNAELLDFIDTIQSDAESILQDHEYKTDLARYKNMENVNSDGKRYDRILSRIRLFKLESKMHNKRILYLIQEIEQNQLLTTVHKDLLLNNIIDRLIVSYLSCCHLIKEKVINWEEDLYTGFLGNILINNNLQMFDKGFYELYNYIFNSNLLRYYQKNRVKENKR